MQLTKRKYKKEEVKELLDSSISDYLHTIEEQKERIAFLNEENKRLTDRIEELTAKEEQTLKVLKIAQDKSEEINIDAVKHYEAEILSIKNFDSKWKEYFSYLAEKYPYYNSQKRAKEVRNELINVFNTNDIKAVMPSATEKIDKDTKNSRIFNPKEKIQDYISATSDNGFNIDEVLNPGELELEDLCKELGLIDEQ